MADQQKNGSKRKHKTASHTANPKIKRNPSPLATLERDRKVADKIVSRFLRLGKEENMLFGHTVLTIRVPHIMQQALLWLDRNPLYTYKPDSDSEKEGPEIMWVATFNGPARVNLSKLLAQRPVHAS